MSDMKMQAAVEMSVEQPVKALDQIGVAAEKMAGKVGGAADKAGASVDGVGAGASASADQLTRAEGRMVASIKRVQTQFELAGKTASQKFEFNIAANGLDSTKFEPYLAQLRATEAAQARVAIGAAEATGEMAGLAAVAAGGAFAMWIKGAIDTADSLNDLSKSTSIAVETLSGLKLASKQSGAELEGTAQAINKLSVNMGENAAKFAAIGVTAKEPLEAFKQLADVFSKIDDPQMKAALGAEALGKSWAAAAPLLAEGGQSIQDMVDKGARLSGVTQQLADDADAFNDAMEEWKAGIAGVASGIASGLLPVMLAMSENMSAVTGKAEGMSGSFSPVTETLRAVAVLGGNVAFVLRAVGTEFGGMAAQVAAAARGDFSGAKAIGEMMTADAVAARSAFDKWEAGVLSAGEAVANTKKEVVALTDAQKESVKAFSASSGGSKPAKAAKEDFTELFQRSEQMKAIYAALGVEMKDIEKQNDDYAKSVASLLDPVEKEASALEAQAANYGLTRAQIEATTIARLEEAKAIATANGSSSDSIAFYEREIDARKRIASASASVESQKASEDAAKKSAQDWEKTSDKTGDSITDALMRGFESGKGFAENLRDSIVNMFNTMVLRPVVQAAVVGASGLVGLGGSSNALAGSAGTLGSVASTDSSLYNAFSGSASGMYGSFATSGVGSALGLSSAGAGGVAQAAGVMGSSAASGAGMSLTTLGAAVPYIGAAIAVAGLVSSLLSSAGGPKNKIMGWGGMDSLGQVTMGGADNVLADGGGPTSRKYDFSPLSAVYTQAVTAAVRQVGSGYASAASLSTTMDPDGTAKNRNVARIARAEGGLVYNNTEKTGKGKDDWAKWAAEESPKMQLAIVADAMRTVGADYKSIAENFVGTSTDMTAAIKDLDSAAVTEMMSTLTSMATAFDSISSHLNKSVTGQAIVNMSAFSGTIDTLTTNINTYYSAFFSSAEQVENTRKSLVSSFAEMGMALPASKAAFRGVVEGIDLTTTSGQSMFATMMSLSSAFSQVADAATAAADTIKAQFLSLYETLTSALDDMTTSGDATKSSRASSQMTLNAAVVASQSGQSILPYASAITSAVSELSKPAEDLYASFSEYARAQGRAIASITSLQSVAYSNSHASGLERVPYDGYQATLHAGEAVVDSSSVAAISRYFGGGGGAGNNAELVAEIRSMRDEIVGLRAEARATATHTNKSAKLLERAMPDGDALSIRAAA